MDGDFVLIKRVQSQEDTLSAYCCMNEAPAAWIPAVCQCRDWVSENLGTYVEGYHLEIAGGEVVGHLYYAFSEQALIPYKTEDGVGVLYCDWVQRRAQGQGYGRRLFETFLEDLKAANAKGVLVETTDLKGQMHFSHYTPRGFEPILESGHRKLLYLPLSQKKIQVEALEPRVQPRQGVPVEILILNGYLCPFEVTTLVSLREVAQEFGEQVVVQDVRLTPETLEEYGAAKGVFINGRQKLFGGEDELAIRRAILEEVEYGA